MTSSDKMGGGGGGGGGILEIGNADCGKKHNESNFRVKTTKIIMDNLRQKILFDCDNRNGNSV